MGEIRRDPLTGRRVIIAPERAQRPKQLGADAASSQPCPFCPGHEQLTPPELWADRPRGSPPDGPGWTVRVVPNKYPAVTAGGADPLGQTADQFPGVGIHEVIVESARHVTNLATLDEEQFNNIFRAYRGRLRAARLDRRWRFATIFKN